MEYSRVYNKGDKVIFSTSNKYACSIVPLRRRYGNGIFCVEDVQKTPTGRCNCMTGNQIDKDSHQDWCGILHLHAQILILRVKGVRVHHTAAFFEIVEAIDVSSTN